MCLGEDGYPIICFSSRERLRMRSVLAVQLITAGVSTEQSWSYLDLLRP